MGAGGTAGPGKGRGSGQKGGIAGGIEWRDAGGGVSAEGGRREGDTVGLCPSQAPGTRGQPIGAATLAYHSLGSGCAEEPGLGDPGTSAAAGPWLGVSVRDQGHTARPVGSSAHREAPAREDEGSSHWCPPRLKGLGSDGVRGPNRGRGSSRCLLRGVGKDGGAAGARRCSASGPPRGLGVAVVGNARVIATRCIPRCHHRLLSHRATSFPDEADVCPQRMRKKGERCPSPSSASSSWRFLTAEPFRRRGDGTTSTSPPTCSGEV